MTRRRAKKRRKHGILILSGILLLILCVGVTVSFLRKTNGRFKENFSETQPGAADEQDSADSVQTIHGIIKDATMNTLTITGEDGGEYSFGTDGVEISTEKTGLMIGNSVTISYRGRLTANESVQEAKLLSIAVTDADSDPEAANPPSEAGKAEALLREMTLEEKVGQMFIARCPETDAVQKVTEYHLGGYILFGRDFSEKTKSEVTQTIERYQDAAKIPLLIGVDEEGGSVNRISANPNLRAVPFWSPQKLYAEGGFDLIRSDALEKCELLRSLGVNLNFAPVCDVSQDPKDFIYQRSFGKDAAQTSAYVQTVVRTMRENGMGSVLKHFPGYGNNTDTHTGIAYDNRPIETFVNSDFLPFQAGIDSGADMVLVSHNIVACMDEQAPASLSANVHKILRNDLGFTGVIITDDLAMDGVRDFAKDTEIAVRAVQAGNDMLCCTDFETQIPAVLKAVKSGEISEAQIDESVLRILEMKISLGII